jgi:hypothetical protein
MHSGTVLHEAVLVVDSPVVMGGAARNKQGFHLRAAHAHVTTVRHAQLEKTMIIVIS